MSRAWWRIRRADSRRRAMRSPSARAGAPAAVGVVSDDMVRVSFRDAGMATRAPPGGRGARCSLQDRAAAGAGVAARAGVNRGSWTRRSMRSTSAFSAAPQVSLVARAAARPSTP